MRLVLTVFAVAMLAFAVVAIAGPGADRGQRTAPVLKAAEARR